MTRSIKWGVFALALFALVLTASSCKKKTPAAAPPAQPSATQSQAVSNDVALPITLPEAKFVGTPASMEGVTNLEPPLGDARPPLLAPKGATNVALHKPVTTTSMEPILGTLDMITDGDKEAVEGSQVELDPMVQSITIDLEAEYELYAVLCWHYHQQERVYFDVIVQVSNDPDFIESKTFFNNDNDNSAGQGMGSNKNYVETNEGKLIDLVGQNVTGRYVRLYSNGNNQNDLNHYLEVEVYGRPVQ